MVEIILYLLFDIVRSERLVGAAETGYAALERATAYAREREVFGRPIGAYQAVQHPIAGSDSKLEAANMPVRKAAWMMDTRRDPKRLENPRIWRNFGLRARSRGHRRAVQAHGGNGSAGVTASSGRGTGLPSAASPRLDRDSAQPHRRTHAGPAAFALTYMNTTIIQNLINSGLIGFSSPVRDLFHVTNPLRL